MLKKQKVLNQVGKGTVKYVTLYVIEAVFPQKPMVKQFKILTERQFSESSLSLKM